MTEPDHELRVENHLVVVFDMCSSSTIIEDLTLRGNIRKLRNFMISLKKWLREQAAKCECVVYKFTGDGWILLFPENVDGQVLVDFIRNLSRFFHRTIEKQILPFLEDTPTVGLTFGIDKGPLVRMIMMERQEFLGRPLNIACRLQNAVKDKGTSPEYGALVSNQVYSEHLKKIKNLKAVPVDRVLRNIRGGNRYKCVKLKFVP